jgi:hypothetical protein
LLFFRRLRLITVRPLGMTAGLLESPDDGSFSPLSMDMDVPCLVPRLLLVIVSLVGIIIVLLLVRID